MGKESALYQLMDIRMNSVMNGIANSERGISGNHPEVGRILWQTGWAGTAKGSPVAD